MKYAVINDHTIYTADGSHTVAYTVSEIIHLAKIGKREGVTHLWVLPGSVISRNYKSADLALIENPDLFTVWPLTRSGYHVIESKATKSVIHIAFPEFMQNTPLRSITDPVQLLRILHQITEAIHMPFEWSPATTGRKLITQLNDQRRRAWLLQPEDSLDIFNNHRHTAMQWARKLRETEQEGYLVRYDKKGAYLSAAAGVKLGTGYLVKSAFDAKKAGIWEVTFTPASADCDLLPHPFFGDQKAFVDTSVLLTAIKLGYRTQIHDGYAFTESHQILSSWADCLTTAKDQFTVSNNPSCTAIIKAMYTQTIGLFNADIATGRMAPWYYRPDWRNAIAAFADLRMACNIVKARDQGDWYPLAVNTDCLYYVSPTPDPVIPRVSDSPVFKKLTTYSMDSVRHLCDGNVITLIAGLTDMDKEAGQ